MTIQTQSTLLKEKVSTHTRARKSNYKKINLNRKTMWLECNGSVTNHLRCIGDG